jgi:hypothetical protein
MEVFHQVLVKPIHRSDAVRDREFRHPANFVENLLRQVHVLSGEVVANIREPCTHVREFLLVSEIGLSFACIATRDWS